MLRSSLRLLFVVPALALVACGSDTTSSTTGSGGGGTTSATGTGGAATTGTGGAVTNACTNAADAAIITSKDMKSISTTCGSENLGGEAETRSCIKIKTGLSDDCASCYSGEVACVVDHCVGDEGKCLIAYDAQLCTDCRKKYCAAAYETCSGNKFM